MRVDFYYGIGSRYSYLASTQVEALEADTGCSVRWLPLFSPALIARRGKSPFDGPPPSRQYERDYRKRDAEDWAEYLGVPYREPEGVDYDPYELSLACLAAEGQAAVIPYSRALFRAVFVETLSKIDRAYCVHMAEQLGLDRQVFESAFGDSVSAEAMEARIDEARARGAFGVPTFFAGDRMFWGNDRLVLLRHHLLSHRD